MRAASFPRHGAGATSRTRAIAGVPDVHAPLSRAPVARPRGTVLARSKGEDASSSGPASAPIAAVNVPVAEREDGLEYLKLEDNRSQLQRRPSPFTRDNNAGGGFVGDKDLLQIDIVQYETEESSGAQCRGLLDPLSEECLILPPFAVRSGPREYIYHDAGEVTAAIVTCGGLCPGLNDVVLNIVTTLTDYGVPEDQILGIRYGLRGFLDRHAKPVKLSKREVDGIQLKGGTVLGTSRGNAKITEIVERIRLWGVTQLYVIGGNGGNAAAHAIAQECISAEGRLQRRWHSQVDR